MDYRKEIGNQGEADAIYYLQSVGFKVLENNYVSPLGEIDIIALRRDTVHFVEVKTRKSKVYGTPAQAITPKKQRKITVTAMYYIKQKKIYNYNYSFDVIEMSKENDRWAINHIVNAFEGKGVFY